MRETIQKIRWNIGILILKLGYAIRDEVPKKGWDWLDKLWENHNPSYVRKDKLEQSHKAELEKAYNAGMVESMMREATNENRKDIMASEWILNTIKTK